MKKLLSMFAAMALVLTLAGCGKEENPDKPVDPVDKGYELALITDVGTIDDKSFNQGSWEGLEKYAKEHNKTYKYYQPKEQSDSEYLSNIEIAIKGGAKVVVCPGFLFGPAIGEAQEKYPDVRFIFVDGTPTKDEKPVDVKENTVSILYREDQAGFLAGYAAVKDGYKSLGFVGGIAVPAVNKFGFGYLAGADAAAKELGITVDVKYTYANTFNPSPEVKTLASGWYNSGVEVIFASAGGAGTSVISAAEEVGKAVIGVDVDQSGQSSKGAVITSAMKNLSGSVYDAIAGHYDGNWQGGKVLTLGIDQNGVELPMATSKFKSFTEENYNALTKALVDGTYKVEYVGDEKVEDVAKAFANLKVDIVK